MRSGLFALVSLLSAATCAFAQTPNFAGTVDEVTPQQLQRGRAAVIRAGYQPAKLQFGQDGNLFFTATRDGLTYGLTVTRSGKVYASNGLAEKRTASPMD